MHAGSLVVTAGGNQLCVWGLVGGGRLLKKLNNFQKTISHHCFSYHIHAGSLVVTAGGNQLCVWDLVGGGRLLKKLTNFQKTVTSVKLSPMAGPESSAAPRLLAGSLDGHVKVCFVCLLNMVASKRQ